MTDGNRDVTQLLLDWREGDSQALAELMSSVHDDLRRLAQSRFSGERGDHTLQATALVNEVYLRLVDQKRVRWESRAHFFAIAATLMRRILVSHARKKRASKRGGAELTLSLDEALGIPADQDLDLVALDDALERLAKLSARQAKVVELRFFGGLSVEETAHVLDVSPATVKLDWSMAKAWLFKKLSKG